MDRLARRPRRLAAAGLMAVAASLASVPEASAEVVLFKSAAGVRLGMDRAGVVGVLGRPYLSRGSSGLFYAPKPLMRVALTRGRVHSLVVPDTAERTSDGLGPGAPGSRLKQVFGKRVRCIRVPPAAQTDRACDAIPTNKRSLARMSYSVYRGWIVSQTIYRCERSQTRLPPIDPLTGKRPAAQPCERRYYNLRSVAVGPTRGDPPNTDDERREFCARRETDPNCAPYRDPEIITAPLATADLTIGFYASADSSAPVGQPVELVDSSYCGDNPNDTSCLAEDRFDFGDGTGLGPRPFSADSIQHTWESTGTYTVTLQVSNREGMVATTSRQITIRECHEYPDPPPITCERP